jgi:hypothetical protein
MSAPDNPQAFPCLDESCGMLTLREPGMTLRDWIAGQALPSVITHYAATTRDYSLTPEQYLAKRAYAFADAMLSHRQHGEG